MNNRSFRGPSGKRYTFDVNHPLITVEDADADHFLQMWEAGVLMFMETAATVEPEDVEAANSDDASTWLDRTAIPVKRLRGNVQGLTAHELEVSYAFELAGPHRAGAIKILQKAIDNVS